MNIKLCSILIILLLIFGTYLFWYVAIDIALKVRNRHYQKRWNQEKAIRIKLDPAITRAELCEQYIMFCKRNDCIVEF